MVLEGFRKRVASTFSRREKPKESIQQLADDAREKLRHAPPPSGVPTPAGVRKPGAWEVYLPILPLAMLTIGGLLTVCTHYIQAWAFLGYLLLVGSPIVYCLLRIERRLKELHDRWPPPR